MRNDPDLSNASAMLVFARVVAEGSFSGAARKLGVSKSSISREIAALETRLGAQLLRRTTRRMSLTETGEVFHRRCLRVVEEVEAAEASVSHLQMEPRGEIRLAAPMSFGHRVLAPLLPDFVEKHPNVRLDVDLTDRVIDLVREKFDLTVRIGRGLPRERTLVVRRLCAMNLILCASPAYLERHGTPERPEDLEAHECLGYRAPPETWNLDGGPVQTRGSINIDNGDALLELALSGRGIVFLPTFVCGDALRAGALAPVLPAASVRAGVAYAAYPETQHLSPKVRAFIDWLAERIGPRPAWDRDLPLDGEAVRTSW